jgi:hypothetical protein
MSAADTKGERLLKTLAQSPACELTEEGRRYIIQRFDPFHDKPIKPVGYPDNYNGHSVARCIKKSKAISLTTGGLPTQATPWDLSVVMTPMAYLSEFLQSSTNSCNTFTWDYTGTRSEPWGGLKMTAQPVSGTDFTFPATIASNCDLGELNLTVEDLADNMRIVSVGFEIQDMTAELYQQGLLTVFRQNQAQMNKTSFVGTSTLNNPVNEQTTIYGDGQLVKLPPINVQNALLMPDTKQWKVKEGAYIVADFNSDELPMEPPQWVMPILVPDMLDVSMDNFNTGYKFPIAGNGYGVFHQIPNLLTTLNYDRPPPPNRILPINQSGCFLTGLNPVATLNVSAIWYVECAPGSEDQELLSLCSQSPAYDPVALKVIGGLRRDSPIGVKYSENYTGEWFFDGIKSIVQKALPWLDNASTIGKQAIKWIDTASTNDGYINPQSFVKGNVAKKVMLEKNPIKKSVVPAPPKRKPKAKAAFRPTRVVAPSKRVVQTRRARRLGNLTDAELDDYRALQAKAKARL